MEYSVPLKNSRALAVRNEAFSCLYQNKKIRIARFSLCFDLETTDEYLLEYFGPILKSIIQREKFNLYPVCIPGHVTFLVCKLVGQILTIIQFDTAGNRTKTELRKRFDSSMLRLCATLTSNDKTFNYVACASYWKHSFNMNDLFPNIGLCSVLPYFMINIFVNGTNLEQLADQCQKYNVTTLYNDILKLIEYNEIFNCLIETNESKRNEDFYLLYSWKRMKMYQIILQYLGIFEFATSSGTKSTTSSLSFL